MSALPEAGADRFARQRLLPGFGDAGQRLLGDARVHVVGAGPAAGPALLYLAQAGVGTLYLDDGEDVGAGDGEAWLYPADRVGQPRLLAALEELRAAGTLALARPHATGILATAALICPPAEGVARLAAERSRLAGLPHVVALASGGGEVVSIPRGAPCFACASRAGAGASATGGAAAAIGALGALELLLLLGRAATDPRAGRRLELRDGTPRSEPTSRRPGCDCRNVY